MSWSRVVLLFRDAWVNLRWVDVVDVLVVTVFFYTVITWFRTARSRFVLTGIGVLGALYFVARALDMYMTLLLFQAAITVAVFALVVIFQEEIRRSFERLGSTQPLALKRNAHPSFDFVDIVVDTLSALARQKTGALVVFKGREPLERHLSGGVPLDGRISDAILQSIFDTSSAGHDGAVIVDQGVIRKFGVHLPLAIGRRGEVPAGTRHAAGLGLSERSDALVVVVSEERGTISVARDGRLSVVSPGELRSRLLSYLTEVSPEPRAVGAVRRMFRNPGAKAMSLVLAVASWLFLFGSHGDMLARTYTVPVGYRNVPDDWILEEPKPLEVLVTLSGTDRAFQSLRPESLRVSLDVSHIRAGQQKLTIGDRDLNLPARISLHGVDPDAVTVVAHDTVTRQVPVRPQTTGRLAPGLWLKALRVNPATVPVVVRRVDVNTIANVLTEPVDLGTINETVTVPRKIEAPKGTRLSMTTSGSVDVTIEVGVMGKPGSSN